MGARGWRKEWDAGVLGFALSSQLPLHLSPSLPPFVSSVKWERLLKCHW